MEASFISPPLICTETVEAEEVDFAKKTTSAVTGVEVMPGRSNENSRHDW